MNPLRYRLPSWQTRSLILNQMYGGFLYHRCPVHPEYGGLKLINDCEDCRTFHESFVGHPKDKEKGR